jgi:hypothetical protein
MPAVSQPLPSALTAKRPKCTACGREMGLDHIEPHRRFINAQVRLFICECGKTTSDLVTTAMHEDGPKA